MILVAKAPGFDGLRLLSTSSTTRRCIFPHVRVNWLDRVDRALMQRNASLPNSAADDGLRYLARAADHSILWLGLAAVLASRGGASRRAAVRGAGAIAGVSVLTNVSAKWLVRRRRPAITTVASHRRVIKQPTSSSFPSGHAASAAAFTTAVALESPQSAAVLAPLASAVAYSRVHTGVHWPSDVAAGAALGASVGLATKRWWAARPVVPARTRYNACVAALHDGQGLVMVVNPASGDADSDPTEEMEARWPAAKLVHPDEERDLVEQLSEAVEQPAYVRALGVAGGDGTVAAAATVAATHGLPLAVVPTGTLNHFGRDVGIVTADDVSRALTDGSAVRVGLGSVQVDGGPSASFVNTASVSGYPEMVRLREQWEPRWGKWPSAAAALVIVLARIRPLQVRLNGREEKLWLLFVGNSGYEPKGFAPAWRPHLDDGVLDVRYVRADRRLSRTRFVLAALSGALLRSRTYVQQEYKNLDIEVMGDPVALACDGEVRAQGSHYRFSARDTALRVYRPAGAE